MAKTTFILVGLLWSALICAGEPLANTAPRPTLEVPRAVTLPRIDANEDDPAWRKAAVISDFSPSLGSEPFAPQMTKALLLWTPEYLYVRFECTDNDIFILERGRDAALYKSDVVEVFLDLAGDARQMFEFQVDPEGDLLDQMTVCLEEPQSGPDLMLKREVVSKNVFAFLEWNLAGLKAVAHRWKNSAGRQNWIVDMAIPAAEILRRTGRRQFGPMQFRANFMRYDWLPKAGQKQRQLAPLNWAPVICGCPHRSPAAMGFIKLVETVEPVEPVR